MLFLIARFLFELLLHYITPGIFMSQRLKIYASKSIAGMLIYMVIILISMLSSTQTLFFSRTTGKTFLVPCWHAATTLFILCLFWDTEQPQWSYFR